MRFVMSHRRAGKFCVPEKRASRGAMALAMSQLSAGIDLLADHQPRDDLARRVADSQPLLAQLTHEQERAVVADKKLLLVAICVLSQWTLEQITSRYRLTPPEGIKYLAQLDRIGIIELKALNRYRLKLAKTFRWRPHGPVMNYFRDHALLDYFAGGFDGSGEGVMLVHGSVSRALAPVFLERLQRVAQDFAQQHQTDQKLAGKDREGYTLVLAMRSWEFEAFSVLRR